MWQDDNSVKELNIVLGLELQDVFWTLDPDSHEAADIYII